ncbi:hypothetical protein AX15_004231 [Amanita polypyramis BW_CC]|nr:hypothetical protein AX15_004231 [Amanita polypyramis BW_CC]
MDFRDENSMTTPDTHFQRLAHNHDIGRSQASISILPPEVLSNIFKLGKSICEDELEHGEADDSQRGSLPFEILATHVNLHFRRIALNTQILWSFIRIGPGKSLSKAAEYIKRSGGCKLDVQLDLPRAELNENAQQMIGLILQESSRWRAFYYRSDCEIQGGPVLSYLADIAAPTLEELSLSIDEIQNPNNHNTGSPPQYPIFSKGAPKLFFVRLRGFAIYTFIPPLTTVRILHLDQTKSLALRNPMFRQVVSAPACLEHLSIYGDMVADSAWPGAGDIVRFPKLISLRICDVGGRAYAGLLLGFDAPVLNALALKGVQEHDLERLWASGDPSKFSNLEHLTFWDFGLLEGDWNHAFRLFSSITSFSSYSSKGNLTMLQLLANSNEYVVPWPRLKSLSLIIDLEDKDEKTLIQSVITARRMCGHPLDVVRLGISEEEDDSYFGDPTRIVYFGNLDRWPLNREFRDWDDNLFL